MYEIGQELVCVEAHVEANVKEGEVYILKGIMVDCCGDLVVNIGISDTKINPLLKIGWHSHCQLCKKHQIYDGIWWMLASRFRPLDDLYNTEIEELMNEVNQKQPFEL